MLALVHASIPNHWIPLVAIGKSERWGRIELLTVTAITGFAHTLSTVLIGIIVGFLGYKLSESYSFVVSVVAPSILVVLGIIYLVVDAIGGHRHDFRRADSNLKTPKPAIVASLCVAMFFSPCIEIEAYYFAAGTLGWTGILVVSLIYILVTVLGMLLFVDLGLKGARRIRSHFLEHHEKRVTGVILVVLGVFTYFVKI